MKVRTGALSIALAAALAASVAGATGTVATTTAPACGEDRLVGLQAAALTQDGELLCLRTALPGAARSVGKVRGLDSGTSLIGIDYRPSNGKLYGVGTNGAIYTVNTATARATKVVKGLKDPEGTKVSLKGSTFGIDFNPAVDLLRVIGSGGQNLRINVTNGVTNVDGTLTYPMTPMAPATTGTGITGAAYTNNDGNPATGTTLFDIDTKRDQVVIQSPANAGSLAATGALGRNVSAGSGFDIYSFLRDGKAVQVEAYAALANGGRSALYEVDLLDGSLRRIGEFPSGKGVIVGLALPPKQ
ncbi:MAG: DUF4394 domain-containing protein [Sporichthyaceae bacterium]